MDLRTMGTLLDNTLFGTLQDMLDQFTDDTPTNKHQPNNPTRAYVRDAKAMARTPCDVKELPNAYEFVVDMPGVKPSDVNVQLEDDNVLVVSGERRRDKEEEKDKDKDKEGEKKEEGVKYLRMERRMGKFMRKFVLPDNANTESISAVCQDGVLTVTVQKLPPPEPKKPKTIEVKVA